MSPVLTMRAHGELIKAQQGLIDLYQCVKTKEYMRADNAFAVACDIFREAHQPQPMHKFVEARFEFIKAQIIFIKAQYKLIEHYAFFEEKDE